MIISAQLVAVECTCWTSSSIGCSAIPVNKEDLGLKAQKAWADLDKRHFKRWVWNEVNKVALPLKLPDESPSASMSDVRRILAVWTPISRDGRSCWSKVDTQTLRSRQWVLVEVEVFSASMYLREIRSRGLAHLAGRPGLIDRALDVLGELLVKVPDPDVAGLLVETNFVKSN